MGKLDFTEADWRKYYQDRIEQLEDENEKMRSALRNVVVMGSTFVLERESAQTILYKALDSMRRVANEALKPWDSE